MSAAIWALTGGRTQNPAEQRALITMARLAAARAAHAELAGLIDTAFREVDTCLSDPDAYPVEPYTCLSQTRDRLAEIQRALSDVIASAAPADSDPAEFPWHVYAQPGGGARWLVNAFTTRDRAERFAKQHPTEYGPLTIECAEAAAAPEQQVTHHAVMRHGIGGSECGTGRVWEPMTRAWKDVTCPGCLASLDVETGGAS